ncbi:MAG: hypothetical protein ABII74_05785 [Elusimicrobiota bacterium]
MSFTVDKAPGEARTNLSIENLGKTAIIYKVRPGAVKLSVPFVFQIKQEKK